MKAKTLHRIVAAALAFVMVLLMVPVTPLEANAATTTYVLESSALDTFAQKDKTDGQQEVAGTDNFFTLCYSAKSKIDSSNKTFADGYKSDRRISFGAKTNMNDPVIHAIKFTTEAAATVKVWWVCGADGRELAIFNSDGSVATKTSIGSVQNTLYITELSLDNAGTYYLGGEEGSNYLFKVEVTTEEVSAPVETTAATTVATEATTVATEATEAPTEPSQPDETPEYDPSKIDVWDFGFDTLDVTKYNNMITVQKANDNFYVNGTIASAGAVNDGNTMGDWSIDGGDFAFAGGGKVNHRLRTNSVIEGLTAHSSGKYLTDDNGVTYNGFLYSNSSPNAGVQVQVKAKAGDILTFVAGAGNAGSTTFVFEGPDGTKTEAVVDNSGDKHGHVLTFYASGEGVYKFYCTNNKLQVARVTRQHTKEVPVTGNVTAPAELNGYSLVFTCNESGAEVVAPVSGGTYSAKLNDSYTYTVSLKDANGYIISSEKTLNVAQGAASASLDVTVIAVDLVTVAGNIKGLSADALAAMTLTFEADTVYIPEVTVSGSTYTVQLEKGVTYQVVVSGINDYELTSAASVTYTNHGIADISLAMKPTYLVTIAPTGATLADLAGATFTFTNLNEEGYVYTFTGTDNILLRDGTYSVKVSNTGIFVQQLTSNLKVNGADVTKTIPFSSDITVWDFSAEDFAGTSPYNGLEFSNASKNKTYLLSNEGTISVPVKGACQIKVSACYKYSFESDDPASVDANTGSTSQIDTFTISYNGDAGYATINVLGQSYITKIEVVETVAFKDTITVGASGCDYTTINAALNAVRAMERPSNERVTIMIQPGNYEEQLVIDVPNVSFKNASSNPSTELKNKGVDIDANAVRITHYYGCGYNYFSMDNNCKYDENILAVNKENGYTNFVNPGDGTGSDSYWNATVIVKANGFQADGIIFENSFNQYVSAKAANDVIVPNGECKEPSGAPRANLPVGSTAVQDKAYVERAAALAIANNVAQVYFDGCKFIGRQDTLYGGTGVTAAFYDCAIYGGTDYIFGGMTAVFAKCDLVFNTSENNNDVGYITAAQTAAGTHGLLMYNCNVTSTTPGVDTASEYTSKPGYFGRPWAANNGEAVFYMTVIDAADTHWYGTSPSLIMPVAWLSTLSGESPLCGEYGTYEYALDVDNSAKRAAWATVFETETLANGEPIAVETWLGSWDPFAGKDMTITMPTDKVDNKPEEAPPATGGEPIEYTFDATTDVDLGAEATVDKAVIPAGTTYGDGYLKIVGSVTQRWQESKGGVYCVEVAKNGTGAFEFTVTSTADVTFTASSTGGSNTSAIGIINVADGTLIENNEGITEVTGTGATTLTYSSLPAGTYQIVSPQSDLNRGARIMTITVAEYPVNVTTDYTFDATTDVDLGAEATVDKAVIPAGTTYGDGYLKIVGSVTQRWQESKGGVYCVEVAKNGTGAFEFTVTGTADVTFTASSTGGSNTSAIGIINAADGTLIENNEGITEVTGTGATTLTYTGLPAGTYQIVSPQSDLNRGARIMTINVSETTGGARPDRKAWADVAAPVITDVAVDGGKITVAFDMVLGYDGADSVEVNLVDKDGNVVETQNFAGSGNSGSVAFNPAASGDYTVSIAAIRADEANKPGVEDKSVSFVLPLGTPYLSSTTSAGDGGITIAWTSVDEATAYNIYVDGALASTVPADTTELLMVGFKVGQKYSFQVSAVRGEEESAKSAAVECTATKNAQQAWSFSAFGASTNTTANGYVGNLNEDGKVTVFSEGGKGKIVPASCDGVAFYYTAVPTEYNFTLRATVTVDSWTLSNGQEGFGLMAADRVAEHGDGNSQYWNNSVMALASKIEYRYDANTGKYYEQSASYMGTKYSMKLGLGTIVRSGATWDGINNANGAVPEGFVSVMDTLDNTPKGREAGTYNIVGNATTEVSGTIAELTTFDLEIQKNNTGYFVSYYNAKTGKLVRQIKYYGADMLNQLDSDNVYVGFFAARNARVTIEDVQLTTILASQDAPAEERPITYIEPTLSIVSADTSNTAEYTVSFSSNVAGKADVSINGQIVATDIPVVPDIRSDCDIVLPKASYNTLRVYFYPDPDQDLGEYTKLASTDRLYKYMYVRYNDRFEDLTNLYVSPSGSYTNRGTKNSPLDIYTAVSVVQPGQTIILMDGTYRLRDGIKIPHGSDGTAETPIRMIADPEAKSRPVLNFRGLGNGITHGGDYWYFQGFDVTNTAEGQKGFQISGHYNVVDNVNAYNNGNTGIQISRFAGTDPQSEWPSNNLILNCTSYNNADPGYEDADGFAAKLTCGEGNVFDGCVAYHNADDGWDMYAKVETGPIGSVTVRNCVAYENGYVIEDGKLVNAGNGNGFKMGGESLSGKHKLINSIAFNNKAKGIDSNSCPDIIVENCISYNNESHNVAFYTNNAPNTDFSATGIISFKDSNIKSGLDTAENLKPKGTQDVSKYEGVTNYYWNGTASSNTAGTQVTSDWFESLEFKGVTRNADGTINMQGFLELTELADENVNATIGGTPSGAVTVNPEPGPEGDPSNPSTGDNSMPMVLALVMMISAAGVAVVFFNRKRFF